MRNKETVDVENYLIDDIKKLSDNDVYKLYKYVRTHLVAKLGLHDPLEPLTLNQVSSQFEEYSKTNSFLLSCSTTTYEAFKEVWIECAKQNHGVRDR